jgi:two-component system, sensor histidine kinase and response regulator
MGREPEIVRILREEEQQRNAQKHTRSSTETKMTPKDDIPQTTHDSMLLFEATPRDLHTLNPNHLEAIYRTVFEHCPVALLVLDTQQRIILWNPYTETFLQRNDKELYFQSIASLHSTEEWMKIKQHLDHPAGLQHHHKTKILLKNNDTVEVQVLSCVLKNNNGNNLGSLYIIKNIRETPHDEYRLDSVVQYADDAIYLLDINCQYLLVNNQLLSRLGRNREEVLGKTFHDFHSCEEAKEFTQKLSWVFEHGIPLKDVHCKDDRWYFRTLNPVKDSSSTHTTSVFVISRDITENKKTEETLVENVKKYRTMFDFSPQMTLLVDTTGKLLEANQRMYDWISYTAQEIQATHLFHAPIFTKESKNP